MVPTWDNGDPLTWADAELPLLWVGERRPRSRNIRAGTVRSTVRAQLLRSTVRAQALRSSTEAA